MGGIEITALTTLVGVMVWYLKYQTKQQSKREDKHDAIQREERLFNRKIITNELKGLHKSNIKNAELNVQGIALQKEMIKDFKSHNGHSKEFSKKMVETLDLICNKIDRRRSNKKVKVDRRT
ncbi:MAG: hypothetical protein KAU83_01635 [Bacteroidales bacterium]|nr:hypothetical protein [Bacteroidales bacterium]